VPVAAEMRASLGTSATALAPPTAFTAGTAWNVNNSRERQQKQ